MGLRAEGGVEGCLSSLSTVGLDQLGRVESSFKTCFHKGVREGWLDVAELWDRLFATALRGVGKCVFNRVGEDDTLCHRVQTLGLAPSLKLSDLSNLGTSHRCDAFSY